MGDSSNQQPVYKYKFSFVMPIYKVEKYLDEAVQSILNQTIGFERNCEIIFINDGSPDNSEEICLKYKKLYPNNIKYIKQENMGVSSARNRGLEEVEGKYVSFLDSDDKLSESTLEEVFRFMEVHSSEVDVAAIKLSFFGAKTGPHMLNWKFDRSRVVDLRKEPEYVQMSCSSTFIKSEAIKAGGYRFDSEVAFAEDAKFVSEILLEKLKIGILSDPTYYYRRRQENNSAINQSAETKGWYLTTPERVYKYLFELSMKKFNRVPKYIQHLVMYDLQWRFKQEKQSVLTKLEEKKYKALLSELIKEIETEVILFQKHIFTEHKLYILKNKFNISDLSKIKSRDKAYFIDGHEVYNYEKYKQDFVLAVTEVGKHNLLLEGTLRGYMFPGVKFGFLVNGNFIEATRIEYGHKPTYFLGEQLYEPNNYKVNVRLRPHSNAQPVLKFADGTFKIINIIPGRYSKLPAYNGRGYLVTQKYVVAHTNRQTLIFSPRRKYSRLISEIRYQAATLRHRQGGRRQRAGAVLIRCAFYLTRPFIRKKIWLVSDRPMAAGDNGEAFYRYAKSQQPSGIKVYFVLSKESKDYERIKKYGGVVDRYSWWYKFLFLHADKIISSAADRFVTSEFGDRLDYIKDLLEFDFVFLQHGVIMHNLSSWLNKFNKNIKLFIVSAERERNSIISGPYGYGPKNIALAGLPRYDLLESEPKNKLIIAPTWRHHLVPEIDPNTLQRAYSESFKSSDYFKFYQELLLDKRINNTLKKKGMAGELYLHPALERQVSDFNAGKQIKVKKFPYNYQQAFREGNLLVTDYSSVAFDFAYLKKPVVYSQFDKEKFYDNHIHDEGYFSFEDNGFGPVAYDYEATVRLIVKAIEDGCVMEKKYADRVEKFFRWNDKLNSHRVYQSILSLHEEEYMHDSVKHNYKKLFGGSKFDKRQIKTYWWRYRPPVMLNFGDEITPYIIKSIWGYDAIWTPLKDAELAGAGSILEMTTQRVSDKPLYIWGSGYMKEDQVSQNPALKFRAVRGVYTRDRVGGKNLALGDPGLLANLVFRRSRQKTHKIGVVAHYIDQDDSVVSKLRAEGTVLLISPLQTPDKVARDITSCEIVFSSSLHGLIFADSFGIPNYWMPISDKVVGGEYKFKDYYSSINRELKKVTPDVLGDQNEIERLKEEYQKVPNLKKIQEELIKSFPFS